MLRTRMSDALPKRPPGRPPANEPGSIVSIWLRVAERDRLIRLAQLHQKSLSAMVREVLVQRLRDQP